jgi:hypothetical protein
LKDGTDVHRYRFRSLRLLLVALLFVSFGAQSRAAGRRRPHRRENAQQARYALKPLESIGATKTRVDAIDKKLHRLFSSIADINFVSLKRVQNKLDSRRGSRLVACGAETDCLIKMGRLLGVRFVVGGDMSKVGRGYALSLKLVNTKKRKSIRRVSVIISGTAAQRTRALLETGYQLLAPKKHTGHLALKVDIPKAKIYIDGQLVAHSPTGPLEVKAGAHNLRITHPSYHDYLRFIDVPFQKTITLKANLTAFPVVTEDMKSKKRRKKAKRLLHKNVRYRPLPWYRKWYFAVGIGVGAALLAGTATALGIALSKDATLRRDLTIVLRP